MAEPSPEASATMTPSRRQIVCILAVVCTVTLPFLGRAVFLDEHLLLQLARSALSHHWWLHQDVPTTFFGIALPNLSTHTHPPVLEYFLAVLYKVFGRFAPIGFRSVFLLFPLTAALTFYQLSKRFTDTPCAVTLLFICSPAFVVMASTLMADLPSLTFALLAYETFFQQRLRLSSMFFALALGTTYSMVIPFGCVVLWMVTQRTAMRDVLTIAAAGLPLGLWLCVTAYHFHAVPLAETAAYLFTHHSVTHNGSAVLSFLGGTAVLPWAFILLQYGRQRLVTTSAVCLAGTISLFREWPSIPYQLAYIALASSGLALLIYCVIRQKDTHPLFALWLAGGVSFLILVPEMIAARYLLFVLPPIYFICFKELKRTSVVPVVVATLALSLALAVADYRLAGAYRAWVNGTIPRLQEQGFRIWSGAESGLRSYLAERDIEPLSAIDLRPVGSDLVVQEDLFTYGLSEPVAVELIHIHSDTLNDSFGLRTLSATAEAGFHDSRTGLLPYVFSTSPLDRVTIAEISPFVRSLPQHVPSDYSSVPLWSPDGVLLKQVDEHMTFYLRIPHDIRVAYELQGAGEIVIDDSSIHLIKREPGPILWKNFRFLPKQFDN